VSSKAAASASIYTQSKNALRIKTLALYKQKTYKYYIITSGYQNRPPPGDPSNDARGKMRHPLATA
jgi:hypothetical protein